MNFEHRPVLLNETIDNLCIKPGGTYVDGTLGGGGHAYEVVRRLSPQGRFIGIDQDADAIRAAGEKLADYSNVALIRSNYCNIREELMGNHVTGVDGILLDLGVSSYQLDTPARGFSYKYDSPLDMRMDQRSDMTAGDIVNGYSQEELYRVIRDYGEERFAKKIAGNIVAAREEKEITSTSELAEIIKQSIPMKFRKTMGHPAKQTFQAIRIELNRELDVLEETLDTMIELLNPGGRLCIITFHSLEDRIVKNGFKRNENPCTCPPDFPVCVCGKVSMGRVVTRKPVIPSEEEMNDNPRSKSAKLRVFEKRG
ncbi:MAG: 16S rRNA (cytosine(1402)-N(4))-methyltransferase RsmH [Lachnospiraceae bacterium]|nr:16S rRNA (cytosine(1402)-N(4))-methyltransferase RsmH [Lachnospiraceae bacterium]